MTGQRFHSMVALVRTRRDLPHHQAMDYWANEHAHKVRASLPFTEYRQHHFDPEVHGFWPAETITPPDWPLDGIAEIDRGGLVQTARALLHVQRVWFDEQNVFDMVDQHMHLRANARRWDHAPTPEGPPARGVLLLRRRHGISRQGFDTFVHKHLGPALAATGASEVRTHTFLPSALTPYPTPGVQHDTPPQRRTDAVVIVAVPDRSALLRLGQDPGLQAVLTEQSSLAAAVQSYAVNRTIDGLTRP